MTYGEVYYKFFEDTKIDPSLIEDYRPAVNLYTEGIIPINYIPNALVIWLTNGSHLIYIAKEEKV